MPISVPKPPQGKFDGLEWLRWAETMWRRVMGEVSTSGDAAHTLPAACTYHGVTALTAPRTLTLPSASFLRDGDWIVIQDESGSAGTHNITIAASGSDTVSGTVTISSNYGRRTIIKRGSGKFFSQ